MKAPWSGDKVSTFIRILAWFFVLCATFAIGGSIYFSYKDGLPKIEDFRGLFGAVSGVYLYFVFLKVALSGKAPLGWIPWR